MRRGFSEDIFALFLAFSPLFGGVRIGKITAINRNCAALRLRGSAAAGAPADDASKPLSAAPGTGRGLPLLPLRAPRGVY